MKDLGTFTDEVLLPGVEQIVEEKISPLRDEMRAGFKEMRAGFAEVKGAIASLAGDIAELNVREEDQKHEVRIRRLEEKVGIRGRG